MSSTSPSNNTSGSRRRPREDDDEDYNYHDDDEEEEDDDDEDDDDGPVFIPIMQNAIMRNMMSLYQQRAMFYENDSPRDSMMPFMSFFDALQNMEEEAEAEDDTVKCPVCQTVHEMMEDDDRALSHADHKCSHGATLLFVPADCPVCMEEKIEPPLVALSCGHVVCKSDFRALGGYIGKDQPPKEEHECCPTCTRQQRASEAMSARFREEIMGDEPPRPGNDQDDEDDISDDDMPPLVSRENVTHPSRDDDDSEDDLPPLESGSNEDTEDSEDDDDPPPLVLRPSQGGDSDSSCSNRNDEPPSLVARAGMQGGVNTGNDSDDDSDPPSLRSRYNSSDEEDESDDDLPPLLPRDNDSDDSSKDDDDDDVPPLLPRSNADSDDSSSDDGDPTPMFDRRNQRYRVANYGSDSDSDEPPPLVQRQNNDDSSDSDSDDDARTPAFRPTHRFHLDSSDDDDSSDDESAGADSLPLLEHRIEAQITMAKWFRRHRARRTFQRTRQTAIHLQACIRRWAVQTQWKDVLQERIQASKRFRAIWTPALQQNKSSFDTNEPSPWQRLKTERFDSRRQTAWMLEDGENADDIMQDHTQTTELLDSAIQIALQNGDQDEDGDDTQAEATIVASMAAADDEEEPLSLSTLAIEDRPKCDNIKLTKDVVKWLDRQDSKYRGLFLRRICQLANGERSRILKKNLTGCRTTIWETYLDQKSGQRILWTEYRDKDSIGILIWYVAKHDNVSKLIQLIDDAENRSRRKLTLASTLFEEDDVLHLEDSSWAIPDPLGDTPLKVHELPRADLPKLANRHWKPRLSLTKEETMCVQKDGTVLLLGRSGTGKTVCIADRMEHERQANPQDGFSQLFVARSYRICSYVKGLVESGNSADAEASMVATYTTYARLLKQCESRLNIKPALVTVNHVDFGMFRRQIYPSDAPLDVLIVWSQIRSFIKGSMEAVQAGRPLTLEEYLGLGESRCRLSQDQRRLAYAAYESYRNHLEGQELWDECDRINLIVAKLKGADYDTRERLSYHKVYVDEIQDYTQGEIALFFLLCRRGGLFLAGDTAQSVVEGVEFRFEEVRSVGYLLYSGDPAYVPDKPLTVNRNFRSHAGVLNVAAAVLERMFAAFPKSANKLDPDVGVFSGPRPGLLYHLTQSKLQELVARLEGAVLLTHDQHVEDLQKMIGEDVMVLGIRESKGLEFPNILVVNFFGWLADDHQKPWRQLLSIRETRQEVLEIAPEVECQLKLLYTAITRCSKRLFFAETSASTSGSAFVKWATYAKNNLAMKQAVDDVEQMTRTCDEWLSAGVDCAMEAETMEEPLQARKWLGFAMRDLEKGNDRELLVKAQRHLRSVEFRQRLAPYSLSLLSGTDMAPLDVETVEFEAGRIMSCLLEEGLWMEVRNALSVLLPLVGDYSKKRLQHEFEGMLALEA